MRLPKRLLLTAALAAVAGRRLLVKPYDLTGKVALITGGSRGLGLALARELAARGAKVALLARGGDELAKAATDLRGRGADVLTITGDVKEPADLERAVAETAAHFGRLDVAVSNAGIIQAGPLADMTEEDFREIMDVNAFAALRLTRAALPHLKRRRGRVLIVSSVAGRVAVPHLAPYSMSKFASAGLGQVLRAELAPHGVGVTTVLPGLMRTGSARQATFKGRKKTEYALFATLDNLPVLSLEADEAARRIVNALVRGQAEAMIGGPAQLLHYAHALAPQLTADLLALSVPLLPGATGNLRGAQGKTLETPLTLNNPTKKRTEAEFNEGG